MGVAQLEVITAAVSTFDEIYYCEKLEEIITVTNYKYK